MYNKFLKIVAAVAAALKPLISSEKLSGRRALALVEKLCADSEPEVRRQAVQALGMFSSRRALRLANQYAADSDPETASAAEEVIKTLLR